MFYELVFPKANTNFKNLRFKTCFKNRRFIEGRKKNITHNKAEYNS